MGATCHGSRRKLYAQKRARRQGFVPLPALTMGVIVLSQVLPYTLPTDLDPELRDAIDDPEQLPAINKDRVPPIQVLAAMLDQALAAMAQGRTVAP